MEILEFIFFRKTLDSIIYIEWKRNLHLGRLKVFWFFLDDIGRDLQWRIKTDNGGKNSTKIGMSHRSLKNEILPDG